jgi:transcriptional regulator with XRE-family HTH domain
MKQAEFGPSLRIERERRRITLEQIAEHTKISASLLASMERNDVSRWPKGIFRRSFIRAYAEAIGLSPDQVATTFLRLFPEDGGEPVAEPEPEAPPAEAIPDPAEEAEPEPGLRLSFALDESARRALRWSAGSRRLAGTALDLLVVAMAGAAAWWWGSWTLSWVVIACTAVSYQVAGGLVLGCTPGIWLFTRRRFSLSLTTLEPVRARRRPQDRPVTIVPRRLPARRLGRQRFHA